MLCFLLFFSANQLLWYEFGLWCDGSIFRSKQSKHGFRELSRTFSKFSPRPNCLTRINSIKIGSRSFSVMFFIITLWKIGGKLRLFGTRVWFVKRVWSPLKAKPVRNSNINKMSISKIQISPDPEGIRVRYFEKSLYTESMVKMIELVFWFCMTKKVFQMSYPGSYWDSV